MIRQCLCPLAQVNLGSAVTQRTSSVWATALFIPRPIAANGMNLKREPKLKTDPLRNKSGISMTPIVCADGENHAPSPYLR